MPAAEAAGRRVPRENEMAGAKAFPAVSLAAINAALTRPGSPFEIEERIIRGVRTRVWKNAPPTLRDVFAARPRLRRAALPGLRATSASASRRFARAALARRARLRGRAWARATGSPSSCATCRNGRWRSSAAALVGAIVTPLNAWWTGPELEYGLADSGAKVAIVDRERCERLAEHLPNCPELERVYVSRERRGGRRTRWSRKLEDVIGERQRLGSVCRTGRCPTCRLEPEDDATHLLHLGHHRASRRARSAPTATSSPTSWHGRCAGARASCARGEPPPAPDPNAPQKAILLLGAVLPRDRLLRGADPAHRPAAARSC